MASNFKLGTSARNAACNGIVGLIDAGTPPGLLKIWTGAPPTNVSDADSGTLLGTLTFSTTAFGGASAGTATAASITSDSSADNSGTAGYFRVYNAAGTCIFQGTCGTASADMIFDNATIVAGGVIAVTSFTITIPVQ